MIIKQKPEDFSVKESYRFDEVPSGTHRVYLMDKQKLSTFDAITRIQTRFGLKPGSISYCGLKDKQGRTEQIIAVNGKDVDIQEPDLRLSFLGNTDKPLSARNITSNRFSVTVRSLSESDLGPLNLAVAEVNRLGVVNYFDSQRFGSLKHGQGFIAKDLLRGEFEVALKNFLAKPSPLDRTEDAKIKEFWQKNWGQWDRRVPFEGVKKYFRILESLRKHPNDYVRAFLQIDKDYRAMQLFTYQSYLWNESVRRFLQLALPREKLFPMQYQAGTLLFHRDADATTLDHLKKATVPLLAPQTTFTDPQVEEAVKWILGREKLKLEDLQIKEAGKLLFFKHEERPLIVFPQKLVIGRVQQDELNRGQLKVNVAFTLPPGAYATLVVKRLFHSSYKEESVADIRASQRAYEEDRRAREEAEESYGREGGRLEFGRPARPREPGREEFAGRGRTRREEFEREDTRARPGREEFARGPDEAPRGARGRSDREEAPRGARGRTDREEAPRGRMEREEAPRGARGRTDREEAPRGRTDREEAPRGRGREEAPRGRTERAPAARGARREEAPVREAPRRPAPAWMPKHEEAVVAAPKKEETPPMGFRDRQKANKTKKAEARVASEQRREKNRAQQKRQKKK